jgi:hypothetical protein
VSDRSRQAGSGSLGLYRGSSFQIVRGADAGEATIRQARFYFADEIVAAPSPPARVAGFARGMRPQDDVRRWAGERDRDALELPPLVWLAAPDVVRHARISPDAREVTTGDARKALALALAPKHPLNRSYFDESSARFFSQRDVKLRGWHEADRFVARTIWPEDFALPASAWLHALDPTIAPQAALRERVREQPHGGARAAFATTLLWQRGSRTNLRDGYALALVLTGAQGDDDEAHAGHFALATGVLERDGAIADWIVDNFYALDSESEKGIIGAPVPLDNYLADLNAGQAWYRPTVLLVATLRDARAAALVQGAMNRVYNHFYRHQLHYDHAAMNCTGISVDTLRTLGLPVASRKPAWRAIAPIAWPLFAAVQHGRARQAYDYATEDATRLLPACAFEEIGAALCAIAARTSSARGELAAMLAEDLDALAVVRIPQVPSSRAWGDAPVVTLGEYRRRLPARREDMKIVPVPARPFLDALRDDDLLKRPWRRSSIAIALWIAVAVVATALVVRAL